MGTAEKLPRSGRASFHNVCVQQGKCVNIGGPGANDWDVQVKQTVNKALMNGKTYRLSFDASASVPRDIKGVAQLNGAPYTNYMMNKPLVWPPINGISRKYSQ